MVGIKISDIVRSKRPTSLWPEGGYIRAKDVFCLDRYYIVIDFWKKSERVCKVMNSAGEISWIDSGYLRVISRVEQ